MKWPNRLHNLYINTQKNIQGWLLIAALSACPVVAHAQSQIETQEKIQHQPRIALVLGGGGARGAAHIGVLEVIEREHIPLSCIVGTSMGGLTAGAYAAGLSPKEMREQLEKADWTDIFLDSADYSQLGYRKKRVTRRFLSGTELGLAKGGIQLKPGVIAGEKIKLFFNNLVRTDVGKRNLENLALPIAVVATDIGTGKKFVFKSGSLALAMRASMSVPGLMTPIDFDGHKLVDGGLVDNLPIEVARDLCQPDVIIAVDVSSPLKPAEQVTSLLSVTGQMIGILTQQNVAHSIVTLTPNDIYLAPKLGEFSATDFAHYSEAANIGRTAAEAKIAALQQYSVDEKTYATWRDSVRYSRDEAITIDKIAISPLVRQPTDYIAQHIHQKTPALLDRTQLEKDLIHIYGDGFYESVDYNIETHDDKNTLHITALETNWRSDYFTFGFDINNEYRQGTNFDLRAAYRSTWLNYYGGEIFATADIGSNPGFTAEFYQPLNYRQTYFVQPSYYRENQVFNVFIDDKKVAEYELTRSYAELALGQNLDIYGQAKLGWREYDVKGTSNISSTSFLGDFRDQYGGAIVDLIIDRRNRLHFPSRGWSGHISYFESREEHYGKLTTDLDFAYPVQDFVVAGRASYIQSTYGQLPISDAAYLGGFLNLSAYASNQIIADGSIYAHLRAERIIGRMPLGLDGDLRLGFGLEGAKLKNPYTFTGTQDWLNSAVIYLGGETPLGPAYLGAGFSDDGKINLYLQIGAH